ncbi:hypothetical protein [Nisaea sp.]|uniref:hypothetical protein n=1 Tax=Nisaea sp. TaxID=2024842 RepID=UPI00326477E2
MADDSSKTMPRSKEKPTDADDYTSVIRDFFYRTSFEGNPFEDRRCSALLGICVELSIFCRFRPDDLQLTLTRFRKLSPNTRKELQADLRRDWSRKITLVENRNKLRAEKYSLVLENKSKTALEDFPPFLDLRMAIDFSNIKKNPRNKNIPRNELIGDRLKDLYFVMHRFFRLVDELFAEDHRRGSLNHDAGTGVHSHTETVVRSVVVSQIMDQADSITRLSDDSLESMRIVLRGLMERRSNGPAEGLLKDHLVILIQRFEDAREATAKVAETGEIADAEVAADKIEKSWKFFDQSYMERAKDLGFTTVAGSLCFGLALGATAVFTAAGFPIPTLAALAVSGGIFGVKNITKPKTDV